MIYITLITTNTHDALEQNICNTYQRFVIIAGFVYLFHFFTEFIMLQ